MTRTLPLLLLLSLPCHGEYVVKASTWSMVTKCSDEIDPCIMMESPCCNPSKIVHTDYRVGKFVIEDDKDEADDLAAALNESHERRTKPFDCCKTEGMSIVCYRCTAEEHEACPAPDSCGKDPGGER